jgi:hypothetical protein
MDGGGAESTEWYLGTVKVPKGHLHFAKAERTSAELLSSFFLEYFSRKEVTVLHHH